MATAANAETTADGATVTDGAVSVTIPLASTAIYARDNGQCVGLSFWGAPPVVGWNPFLHNGADCN